MTKNSNGLATKNAQNDNLFLCKLCHYTCSRKYDYDRHVLSAKHQKNAKISKIASKSTESGDILEEPVVEENQYHCSNCKKTFYSRSGLWRHGKLCKSVKNETNFDFQTMFLDIVKQNDEFKKIMMEQTKCILEQNSKLMELANNQSITNNNNGTINNTMNKFNLNFFLNETCKDAMNIQEFIDYVKVQHSDFENFGKYGYVESMTRIIMRNLMELEVHRRPIHCTDAKREVLYVKDNNVWVNDFSREKLIRAIKYIAAKNVKQIPDWMDHNPDSKNTQTKLHDKYMRMVCHSMGGRDEAEDQEYYKKIIRNVAKEVVIDKMK